MNVLSELIPGARQLRTPLAIGYLWFTVAWLNAPRFETYIQKSAPLGRVLQYSRNEHLTPALIIFALTFFAYLAGIFFQVLGDIAVTLGTILVITVGPLAVGMFVLIRLAPYLLWLLALSVAWIIIFGYRHARLYSTDMGNEIAQGFINIALLAQKPTHAIKRLALRVWSPATYVKRDFELDHVARILETHPELIRRFCETLSYTHLREACIMVGLQENGALLYETKTEGCITLSEAAPRSWIDKESNEILRSYLRDRLESNHPAAGAVITRVIQGSSISYRIRDAVLDAETRIRAQHRHLFEDSDRLHAEGEFRCGVALPLAAIVFSVCSFYTSRPIIMLAISAPMALVYVSGLQKQEDGAAEMIRCITAGLDELKLEDFDTSMLGWPTSQSVAEDDIKIKLAKLFSLQIFHRRKKGDSEQLRLF